MGEAMHYRARAEIDALLGSAEGAPLGHDEGRP